MSERLGVRGRGDRRQGDEGLGHSRRGAIAFSVPPGHGLALAQIPHLPRPYGVGPGVGSLRSPEVAQWMPKAIRCARARAKNVRETKKVEVSEPTSANTRATNANDSSETAWRTEKSWCELCERTWRLRRSRTEFTLGILLMARLCPGGLRE